MRQSSQSLEPTARLFRVQKAFGVVILSGLGCSDRGLQVKDLRVWARSRALCKASAPVDWGKQRRS